jgi:hypothetical protein
MRVFTYSFAALLALVAVGTGTAGTAVDSESGSNSGPCRNSTCVTSRETRSKRNGSR